MLHYFPTIKWPFSGFLMPYKSLSSNFVPTSVGPQKIQKGHFYPMFLLKFDVMVLVNIPDQLLLRPKSSRDWITEQIQWWGSSGRIYYPQSLLFTTIVSVVCAIYLRSKWHVHLAWNKLKFCTTLFTLLLCYYTLKRKLSSSADFSLLSIVVAKHY